MPFRGRDRVETFGRSTTTTCDLSVVDHVSDISLGGSETPRQILYPLLLLAIWRLGSDPRWESPLHC